MEKLKFLTNFSATVGKVYNHKHPNSWYEQQAYIKHTYNMEVHYSTQKYHIESWFGYFPWSPFVVCAIGGKWEEMHEEEDREKMFIDEIR